MSITINLTVNRIPRDKDNPYTMIPNAIIRDKNLSCKAKSVLIYLIGERDNSYSPTKDENVWTMTVKGLSNAFRESVGSIRRCLKELMECGYLVRTDIFNKKNLRVRTEYTVYESPLPDATAEPLRKYENDVYEANNRNDDDEKQITDEAVETVVKANIDFDTLASDYTYDLAAEYTDIITDTLKKTGIVWIGKKPIPSFWVQKKLLSLDNEAVSTVIESVKEQPDIKHWDKYVLSSLYNVQGRLTFGASKLAVDIVKSAIHAHKSDTLTDWWNSNRDNLSLYEVNIVKAYIRNKYKWDQSAYDSVTASMIGF